MNNKTTGEIRFGGLLRVTVETDATRSVCEDFLFKDGARSFYVNESGFLFVEEEHSNAIGVYAPGCWSNVKMLWGKVLDCAPVETQVE